MRFALGTVFALVVQLAVADLSPAQKHLEKNPYYLRADRRLQVSLNVQADHPKLSLFVAKLRDVTGLNIAVDDSLHDLDPDYGYIQPSKHGYHAWQIMEMIAKKDLQDGFWKKTEGGYRLIGSLSPSAIVKAKPNFKAGARLLLIYFLSTIPWLVMWGIVLIRRWRQPQQDPTTSARRTAPQSPSSA